MASASSNLAVSLLVFKNVIFSYYKNRLYLVLIMFSACKRPVPFTIGEKSSSGPPLEGAVVSSERGASPPPPRQGASSLCNVFLISVLALRNAPDSN